MAKRSWPYNIREVLRAVFRERPELLNAKEQVVRAAFAAELTKRGHDTSELPNDIWRARYNVRDEIQGATSSKLSASRPQPPRIEWIELVNFRQFQSTHVELPGQISVLAGANNSGKTTVLWAIKAFFQIMRNSVTSERGGFAFHNRYVKASDFMPVPNDEELWYNKKAPGSTGNSIRIRVRFANGLQLTLVMLAQFGQIHASCEELPASRNKSGRKSRLQGDFSLAQINSCLNQTVDFIPGLVGVLITEPYVTPARRESLAAEGRYSDIFRSSLIQLCSQGKNALKTINAVLARHFSGFKILAPTFEPNKNEFVEIKLNTGHTELDIVNSGSGLQQVVQILAYLYLTRPSILLVDEPDAHLHPTLQQAMGGLLKDVAKDLGAQLIVSTHSYDLIDTFPHSAVILVDATRARLAPLKSDAILRDKLIDSGLVANSALLRLWSARRCLVLEDTKKETYKAIDEALGTNVMSGWAVRSAQGVGKFGDAKNIVDAASGLLEISVEFRFLQDLDGLSPDYAEAVVHYQREQHIEIIMLTRHEIESYLLDPAILISMVESAGLSLCGSEAESVILGAATELKPEARYQCKDRHLAAVRLLPKERIPGFCGNGKPTDKEVEIHVNTWFDLLPDDVDTVLRYYPGKALMHAVLSRLGTRSDHQFTQTQLHNALSARALSPDIKKVFTRLQKMGR